MMSSRHGGSIGLKRHSVCRYFDQPVIIFNKYIQIEQIYFFGTFLNFCKNFDFEFLYLTYRSTTSTSPHLPPQAASPSTS